MVYFKDKALNQGSKCSLQIPVGPNVKAIFITTQLSTVLTLALVEKDHSWIKWIKAVALNCTTHYILYRQVLTLSNNKANFT